MTDGEANNEKPNLVDDYTKDIISRGITLDAIGVAMQARHTLATKVDSYRSANDPASFTRAVREVFAEISTEKSNVAGEDAFDLISGIPTEVATGMLSALSKTGNYPIGERPFQSGARQVRYQQNSSTRNIVNTQVQAQRPVRRSGMPFLKIIMTVFIVIIILAGIVKISSNS